MNTAVVTCTNKDNSLFYNLLWTTNLEASNVVYYSQPWGRVATRWPNALLTFVASLVVMEVSLC